MKNSIFRFTFIIIFIIFLSSSLFSLYSNPNPVINITYGSSSSSSISGENQQLIDKIAIKITDAKPSADYISVKKVLERLALQEQNKGGNAQESLTKILNQISLNLGESKVVDKIVNLALKESSSYIQQQQQEQQPSNTQQQNQVTPQSANDFSNIDYIMVSDKALKSNPNDTDALNGKGDALYDLEKYDEAIQNYDKVLQIDPKNQNALDMKNTALKELDGK
jgi:tetratricopeptide (TPR) repeat protein